MPDERETRLLSPPDGCVGKSIVRKSTVTGRLVMTLGDSLLYDSGTFQPDSTGITLHMRGNTSSYNLTPSYKLKLQQRADLLQRGDRIYRNKHCGSRFVLGVPYYRMRHTSSRSVPCRG